MGNIIDAKEEKINAGTEEEDGIKCIAKIIKQPTKAELKDSMIYSGMGRFMKE